MEKKVLYVLNVDTPQDIKRLGGIEEGKEGRSYATNKTKVVIAVELTEKKRVK